MATHRIQHYMEKHKITPLFEELMNRVLHDQPDEPLVYLITVLYRKAGLQVPKELKTALHKRPSSPEKAGRRSKSPDKTQSQAWAIGSSAELVDRSYDKPWQRGSKKHKPRDGEKTEGTHKPGRKKTQEWVSDTKVTTTTFDDLFAEGHGQEETSQQTREATTDIQKAWAKRSPLKDAGDVEFRSRGYSGPRCDRNKDDPLAGEIMLAAQEEEEDEKPESSMSSSHIKGPKLVAEKHREELGQLLTQESDEMSTDSGYSGRGGEEEDDAIELLEDPEDLRREGVTNIPASGVRLSRILRQRQENANIKLNINLFTGSAPTGSVVGKQYGDYSDSDLERPATGMSQYSEYSPGISDDEFESVSQVVGPKPPVWSAPDSDGETTRPRLSKTLPEPARKTKQTKFSSTTPVRIAERLYQPEGQSTDTENIFLKADTKDADTYRVDRERTPESPEPVRDSGQSSRSQPDSTRYGWTIPGDTEVSVATEWTEANSSVVSAGPPKAY